jgi:hypothetical protein
LPDRQLREPEGRRLAVIATFAACAPTPVGAQARTHRPAVRFGSNVPRNIQADHLSCSAPWNYSYQIAQQVQGRHLFGRDRTFNWDGWRIRVDRFIVVGRKRKVHLSFALR